MSKDTIIVDLNNEAVSYLQEGNYRAAVWDLEVSMDRLMSQEPGNNYDPGALRVASVPIAPSPEAANNNNIIPPLEKLGELDDNGLSNC